MSSLECYCNACLNEKYKDHPEPWYTPLGTMILCQECGNKRCPHAANHENICTNSNEPGQPGSNYPSFCGVDCEVCSDDRKRMEAISDPEIGKLHGYTYPEPGIPFIISPRISEWVARIRRIFR